MPPTNDYWALLGDSTSSDPSCINISFCLVVSLFSGATAATKSSDHASLRGGIEDSERKYSVS